MAWPKTFCCSGILSSFRQTSYLPKTDMAKVTRSDDCIVRGGVSDCQLWLPLPLTEIDKYGRNISYAFSKLDEVDFVFHYVKSNNLPFRAWSSPIAPTLILNITSQQSIQVPYLNLCPGHVQGHHSYMYVCPNHKKSDKEVMIDLASQVLLPLYREVILEKRYQKLLQYLVWSLPTSGWGVWIHGVAPHMWGWGGLKLSSGRKRNVWSQSRPQWWWIGCCQWRSYNHTRGKGDEQRCKPAPSGWNLRSCFFHWKSTPPWNDRRH